MCPECDVNFWSPLVLAELARLAKLARSPELEPDNVFVTKILPFLVVNRIHSCRLHFLYMVLMSRNSVFRQFTYYCGGINGSVSETEDVLDRIMRFLWPSTRCGCIGTPNGTHVLALGSENGMLEL